jgi:hypothetical protein
LRFFDRLKEVWGDLFWSSSSVFFDIISSSFSPGEGVGPLLLVFEVNDPASEPLGAGSHGVLCLLPDVHLQSKKETNKPVCP